MAKVVSAAELQEELNGNKDICVIDVRRKADFDKAPETIAGAEWRDPEKVDEWGKAIPVDQKLVVYCVKGGSVSQSVADSLQQSHPDVRFLEGGILGWQKEQK